MQKTFLTAFGALLVRFRNENVISARFGDANEVEIPVDSQVSSLEEIANTLSRHPLKPAGTDFQLRTWQAVSTINTGQTASYGDIACMLGIPRASRAVASAIARNHIACFIPCHRIIRSNGSLGGYRWSAARKQKILEYEKQQEARCRVGSNT